MVAKEQMMAMLAPRHEAVAVLPRAYRHPLHLQTAFGKLTELTRFLNWLSDQGLHTLTDIDTDCCEAYLAHRRYLRDENDIVIGERGPSLRATAAQAIVDLINHRELFTTDRVEAHLRPWGGATPSRIAQKPRHGANTTRPVPADVLQPLLAAATYLAGTFGPHAFELAQQVKDADRRWSHKTGDHRETTGLLTSEFAQLLARYEHDGQPLPMLSERDVRERLKGGWSPQDPLTPVALGLLARQAGFTRFYPAWLPHLRASIEATLHIVAAAPLFARAAVQVPHPHGQGEITWTLPLDRWLALALVAMVRTAAIITLAAVSGMRSSELMELTLDCCPPPEHHGSGLHRYKINGRIIKRQILGGVPDEWVVIEPAYRAAQLLRQLHDTPEAAPETPLLGRFAFDNRYATFRKWVNGPAGQRLGLLEIPDSPVHLRALRRTLAMELAYRPGGLLATRIHLKHVAIATTEGYAAHPGGAQAKLLAEINEHESQRNLDLLQVELRNYQQGIMPAGPGARELTEFFAHIDTKLNPTDAGTAKVQHNDREVLTLLTKRAATLHLAAANYCWFTDPSRALCLKLADTPNADKPLAGMCDSARCPQATHHPHHRAVWAEHAETTKTFLGNLGATRKTEKTRLQGEYNRATLVLAKIDAANPTTEDPIT